MARTGGADDGIGHPDEVATSDAVEHHAEVVVPVRDITRPKAAEAPIDYGASSVSVAFPFTYDVVLHVPEATETACNGDGDGDDDGATPRNQRALSD